MSPAGKLVVRLCTVFVLSCIALFSVRSATAEPQPKGKEVAEENSSDGEKLYVVVYPVRDLLTDLSDYPYSPTIPTSVPFGTSDQLYFIPHGPSAGGMGGMGGMGGGGGGNGMFSVSPATPSSQVLRQFGVIGAGPQSAESPAERFLSLISIISGAQENETDGPMCRLFGGSLILRHTAAGHKKVSDLVKALKATAGQANSLTVEATWILASPSQLKILRDSHNRAQGSDPASSRRNLERRADLIRQTTVLHGEITCLNGQKVHFATGKRVTLSEGATPTVGVAATGYTPRLKTVNIGAVLQIRPVYADGQAVCVDLQNAVTQSADSGAPIRIVGHSFAGSTEKHVGGPVLEDVLTIDRANVGTQEWSTTAVIPLKVPVVLGSVTLTDPADKTAKLAAAERPDIALVIEVRTN